MVSSVLKQFALCVRSRTEAIMMYSWLSLISLFIVCRGFPPPILTLKLFCAMTGTALGVYLYNDLCDLEDDILGRELGASAPSNRPLCRGLVSKRRMGVFSALLVISGLMMSALINFEVLLLQIMFLILGFIYSNKPIRLKRIFLGKQVTVTIFGAITCLSAGLALGAITVQLLYLTGLYVLFTLGVNPLGDLKDLECDRADGIKTIPVVWGPRLTIRLACATFTAAAITTWIGFYGLGFNIALPIIGTTVLVAYAYIMYPLFEPLGDYEYTVRALYKRCSPLYFILQLAVLMGSIPI